MEKFNLRYLKPGAFIFLCGVLALSLYAANNYVQSHWGISVSIFAAIGGICAIINNYAWNVRPFSWMYGVPDCSGRYEGTLTYEFRDEYNQKVTGTLEHIKVISQNGSDVVINSWTKKDGSSTMSTSREATIFKEKDGTYSLIYNYLNDGDSTPEFPPHYGTEVIRIVKNGKDRRLAGRYYTERLPFQTRGKTELKYISNNLSHE